MANSHLNDLVTDSVLPSPLQNRRFWVLERLLGRLNALPQHVIIMLIDIVPTSALTAFAHHFSLIGDGWEFATTEDEQRELIKGAIQIHRHKGTPWAIKRTLALLGYSDCELQERFGYYEHNNSINHDSNHRYGDSGHWTYYRLVMQKRISTLEAQRIYALLADVAPLRCKLISIHLRNFYHNSVIKHDGTHFYDEVIAQW